MESDIIRYYEQYDEEGRLTRRRWGQVPPENVYDRHRE